MAAMTGPAPEGCQVYDGEAAHQRLAEFGLRPELFVRAFQHGHDRQARCSPVHPRTYRGVVMWAETVAQLRTELLNLNSGWKCGYSQNFETAFRLDLDMAIAVVAGDVNTGVRGLAAPRAARKRGKVTTDRVRRNAHNAIQGELPLELPKGPTLKEDELCATWFHLLRARQDVMYSELSLPDAIEDGEIVSLAERILLEPVPLVGAVTPIPPDDDDRPTIDVERI